MRLLGLMTSYAVGYLLLVIPLVKVLFNFFAGSRRA